MKGKVTPHTYKDKNKLSSFKRLATILKQVPIKIDHAKNAPAVYKYRSVNIILQIKAA